MRHLISIATVLVHLSVLTACDGERTKKPAENNDKPESGQKAEDATSFKSATPVEVDAAELAAMYAAESKNTELQREAKEEELQGKVVEWKGLKLSEVERDGDDCFRLQTSATDTHPAAFIAACSAHDPGIAKLAAELKTDDWIDVRGKIHGVSKRHIELNPATVARSTRDDNLTRFCKKVAEIAAKDDNIPEPAKIELADLEKCKKEGGEKQKEDPEAFKKMSNCVMGVSDMESMLKCAIKANGDD